MSYQPGTHIVASILTPVDSTLYKSAPISIFLNQLIEEFDLQKLGEVYHDFETGGFTAIICLSESHISLHSWPEHRLLNLDIYLSNFQRQNDGTVNAIFEKIVAFYDASIRHMQTIVR